MNCNCGGTFAVDGLKHMGYADTESITCIEVAEGSLNVTCMQRIWAKSTEFKRVGLRARSMVAATRGVLVSFARQSMLSDSYKNCRRSEWWRRLQIMIGSAEMRRDRNTGRVTGSLVRPGAGSA